MSHEAKKESIKTGRKLYESSDTQTIDKEIVLPDYCKEIKKLLKCTFTPGVHTSALSGEKATAKGTGVLRIIYLGEDDEVDVFEKTTELSFSVKLKDVPSDAAIRTKQRVDFLNCRVTGQRKLSVSVGVCTVFSCYSPCDEEYVSAKLQDNIRVKTKKLEGESVSAFFEKTFDMNETVVLNAEHPSPGKIVSCDGVCTLESNKHSSGKLLIKGEVKIDICYLCVKSEAGLHKLTHTMPISQIVDIGQAEEKAETEIILEPKQILAVLKADSSGSNRLIELSLRVSAFISLFMKKECEVITDCYCTDCEISAAYAEPEFYRVARPINEKNEVKCPVEFSSPVKEISFVKCLECNKNLSFTEDKAVFSCNLLFGFFYLDEKGVPSYCEKDGEFELSYALINKCNDPFGEFSFDAAITSVSLSSGDRAEITLQCAIKGKLYCKHSERILKGLEIFPDKLKESDGAALTVYFPEKGESLWDIARLHNTTVELILQENGISDENELKVGMLMIPRA